MAHHEHEHRLKTKSEESRVPQPLGPSIQNDFRRNGSPRHERSQKSQKDGNCKWTRKPTLEGPCVSIQSPLKETFRIRRHQWSVRIKKAGRRQKQEQVPSVAREALAQRSQQVLAPLLALRPLVGQSPQCAKHSSPHKNCHCTRVHANQT